MSQIAFVSRYIGLANGTGAVMSSADTLKALLATGHSITAISKEIHCRLPAKVAGYSLGRLRWLKAPGSLRENLRRALRQLAQGQLPHLWRRNRFDSFKPDLLIANGVRDQQLIDELAGFSLASAKHSALIVRATPDSLHYFADKGLEWAVAVAARYDFLIFVSELVRQAWLEHASLAHKPTFVIPNCCEESVVAELMAQEKAAVRQRLGLRADRLIAVCVASIQPRKGQDLLIEQFASLLQRLPSLELYLIGPILTEWGEALRQAVTQSPMGKRVHFLGFKPNALPYIYAADFLVSPSRAEAFSRVVLEAMALKTAVVASSVGGTPDLIQHEQSGLLFPLDQPQELAMALARLSERADLRCALAEQAHQRYQTHFTRAHQIGRYREAIQLMLPNSLNVQENGR